LHITGQDNPAPLCYLPGIPIRSAAKVEPFNGVFDTLHGLSKLVSHADYDERSNSHHECVLHQPLSMLPISETLFNHDTSPAYYRATMEFSCVTINLYINVLDNYMPVKNSFSGELICGKITKMLTDY
jgi:hypothetical protein